MRLAVFLREIFLVPRPPFVPGDQTIHCQQIFGGVEVKVMHCKADPLRSYPTRVILNFFSLKLKRLRLL